MDLKTLQKKYPIFSYESFSYHYSDDQIISDFLFRIEPDIEFRPRLIINGISFSNYNRIGKRILDNLIFHLGMAEIPSYWKSTCSLQILVKAGPLDNYQKDFFKNLIVSGLGQFFYENALPFVRPEIKTLDNSKPTAYPGNLQKRYIIPTGGGKDSLVTKELLKDRPRRLLAINPTPANKFIIEESANPIVIDRKIDSRLLELNKKGYFNGHTPFSSVVAFHSAVCAIIEDYKYVVVSNERSSNEGNVRYQGREVNHQWSKTFEFEGQFQKYARKYLAKELVFFSLLRPLYELQIASIFSSYPQYFEKFISCNKAGKEGNWCLNCSKCLFAFLILYPFLEEKILLKIFGENLLDKKDLLEDYKALIGETKVKPFECVGTRQESLAASMLCLNKTKGELPFLLQYFKDNIHTKTNPQKILKAWNKKHNLPLELEKILRDNLST